MKARIIGIGLGVLLIVAAFALVLWQGANMNGVAFAQSPVTATPAASATSMPTINATEVPSMTVPSNLPNQPAQQQTIGDDFWGILAGKLNVSPDTLKQQAVAARQQMIDQAVTDGRITQAQGDALKQKITSNNLIAPIRLPFNGQMPNGQQPNGQQPNATPPSGQQPNGQMPNGQGQGRRFPGFGGRFGNGNGNRTPGGNFGPGMGFGGGFLGGALDQLQAVAKALNLDPQALVSQLASGKTLADIAKAQNVDENTVKQAIITARTAQIDQLLSYGLISQAQADAFKAQLTPDKIDLTKPLFFMMRGMQQQTAPGSSSSDTDPENGNEQDGSSQVQPGFNPGQMFSQFFGNNGVQTQ